MLITIDDASVSAASGTERGRGPATSPASSPAARPTIRPPITSARSIGRPSRNEWLIGCA